MKQAANVTGEGGGEQGATAAFDVGGGGGQRVLRSTPSAPPGGANLLGRGYQAPPGGATTSVSQGNTVYWVQKNATPTMETRAE